MEVGKLRLKIILSTQEHFYTINERKTALYSKCLSYTLHILILLLNIGV